MTTPPTSTTPPVLPGTPAAPATPATPAPAIPAIPGEKPAAPGATSAPTLENSGLLTIWVPNEAKVTINGMATRSTGSRRQFVSYGLKPGFSYKYEVHAEIVRDGKIVEENKIVMLTAGERGALAFGFNIGTEEAVAAAN
jgi:uncharacterized protein (TIGR03000 family)